MDKVTQNRKDTDSLSSANTSFDSTPALAMLQPPPSQFKAEIEGEDNEEQQGIQLKKKDHAAAGGEDDNSSSSTGSAEGPPSKNQPFQLKSNNTGLPDNLKSGIEGLSGFSMDDVSVNYNSSKPAQLQAHAYAQGSNIEIGPGQEKHLPHEAWHVVQQKQGRVQPTKQLKAFKVNDDASLEKEADVMGAKAENYSNNESIAKNNTLTTGSLDSQAIQRKLIIRDAYGTPKRFISGIHGQEQMRRIISEKGITGEEWMAHFFDDDEFYWDQTTSSWKKHEGEIQQVDDVAPEMLESTKLLIKASPGAALGGSVGGYVGAKAGSSLGSGIGSYLTSWIIGIPEIGEYAGYYLGGATGLVAGGATGAVIGEAMALNVQKLVKAKTSEIMWSKGIVTDGLELDLGLFDVAKLLSKYKITVNPKVSSLRKHIKLEGNEFQLDNLSAEMALQLQKGPALSVEIPRLTGSIDIVLKDPDTKAKSTQILGDVSITNLSLDAGATLDSSIKGVLLRLLTKRITKEGVIAALEAGIKCERITAGLKIETFASDGQSRRASDLGSDQFDASVDISNVSAHNEGARPNETSGSLGFLAAEVNRTGGKKKASANVHATGEFSSLESLKEAVKGNDAEVHGLKGGALGTGKLAGKAISAGLKKAVDGPNVLIKKKIHKLIHENGGKMTVPEILAKLPPNYTEKDVVYYCQSLVKSKKLEAHNTSKIKKKLKSFIGKDSKEASYSSKGMDGLQDKLEKVDSIGDKIGKRKAQAGTGIASSAIKDKGLDIGLTGESNDGSTSFTAEVHLDKELVEKGYKLLELVGTVIKSVLPPDEDED